jgi:hypothetical protein
MMNGVRVSAASSMRGVMSALSTLRDACHTHGNEHKDGEDAKGDHHEELLSINLPA